MARRLDDSTRERIARVPLVGTLAAGIARFAQRRSGPIPTGLILLLPVALLLDLFDVGDELVFGPIGVGFSFLAETTFLLAVTGRPGYALGLGAIDLVPFVDILPMATITLVLEIARSWGTPRTDPRFGGPVIDV